VTPSTPNKPKIKQTVHVREPTDDGKLILEIKRHYVFTTPRKVIKHESNRYKKLSAIITAYTSGVESTGKSKGDPAYQITTSGKRVQPHLTVACPPSIPLGTWIKIQGIGRRRCDDRGGSIKGHKFDLYVVSYDDAIQFGRQKRTVWILTQGG
jgi:3D (Asp-Asp-Asp) domain-containing protein